MDIKNLVARIKSFRFPKKGPPPDASQALPAVEANVRPPKAADKMQTKMVGVLAVAVTAGIYYFFVYEPEQSQAPAAPPPVAGRPKPAAAQPTANQPAAQPVAPAPGVATVTPGKQQPAAQLPESEPKQAATPEQPAKPEQTAKMEAKPNSNDNPGANQHVPASPADVLLKPAYPSEPAPAPAPADIVPEPVEPAPGEPVPAPVESAAAPEERAPLRGGVTPKYNDVVTAVLRGDREATKELLDLGWWVDKPSASGVTPLMAAVMNRDTEMVQLLLEYGAEPTSQALNLARKNKDTATASLLSQKGVR